MGDKVQGGCVVAVAGPCVEGKATMAVSYRGFVSQFGSCKSRENNPGFQCGNNRENSGLDLAAWFSNAYLQGWQPVPSFDWLQTAWQYSLYRFGTDPQGSDCF